MKMLPVDYVSSVEDEFRKVGNGQRKRNSVNPTSNHATRKVSASLHLKCNDLTDRCSLCPQNRFL